MVNVPFGPYCEDVRYKQVIQNLDSLLQDTGPEQNPFFMHLLPKIMQEEKKAWHPNIIQEVWEEMRTTGPWLRKGTKTVKNRFLGLLRSGRKEQLHWSRRLFGYLHTCIELGFLHKAEVKTLVVQGGSSSSSSRSTSSKQEETQEQALRKAGANQLTIATLFMLDSKNQSYLNIVLNVMHSFERWHGEQNRVLRSVDGALEWVEKQVAGTFLQTVSGVFDAFKEEQLKQASFSIPRAPLAAWAQRQDPVFIDPQDGMAMILGDFAMSFIGNIMKRFLWLVIGWSCRCIEWLDPDRGQESMNLFHTDYKNFLILQENPEGHSGFEHIANRSLFNLVIYEQLVEICKQNDWTVTPAVRQWVRNHNKRIIATQVVEDGFNRQKSCHKYKNRRARVETAMETVLEKEVLGKVHHFVELDPSRAAPHRNNTLPDETWCANHKTCSMQFPGLVGFEQQVKWYSPSASTWPEAFADLCLTAHAIAEHAEAKIDCVWLGTMLNSKHHILVQKKVPADIYPKPPWLFPLAQVGSSSVLCWPAEERSFTISGSEVLYYSPAGVPGTDVAGLFITIFDPNDWIAKDFVWKSPFGQAMQHPEAENLPAAWSLVAWEKEGTHAASLMKVAARNAFWEFDTSWLSWFAWFCDIQVPAGTKLFDMLMLMVQGILECSSKEAVIIVRQRLGVQRRHNPSEIDEMLETDCRHWCFDKSDHADLQKDIDITKSKQQDEADFEQMYWQKCKELKLDLDMPAAGKGRKARRGHTAPGSIPAGELTQVQAKAFTPPQSSIWRSNADSGWAGHLPPYKRRHFSGFKLGHRGALLLCLKDLWSKHIILHGLAADACPWPEIMAATGD